MKRLILPLAIFAMSSSTHAQLRAPERQLQSIADPANVLMDRGSKLEVLPMVRAVPQADSTGQVTAHHLRQANAGNPIGPQQLGVVFNHSMQQQGYISGEIAFKFRAGSTAKGFSSTLYPGLKRITNPEVYVVNTQTPAEFMKVLKRLQARTDIEWVVPTVIYGPAANTKSAR
jgi:hypothetical protein